MSDLSPKSTRSLLRVYLLPYILLMALYLLVIGCGSAWLYFTARQAQTELITDNMVKIVRPFIQQLNEQYQANRDSNKPLFLSRHVGQMYQALPHLRQVSIRDSEKGYGVRLSSQRQLVDVELEPLRHRAIAISDHQQLARQLHQQSSPFFYMDFDFSSDTKNPVQMSVAFDRAGLVGQISDTLQSVIHSIVGFSIVGVGSILVAVIIAVYTGFSTQKMEARLQRIYHQAAMGQLSSSLVHDLRNPLASIRANIKNLLITPEETSQIVEELDHDLLRLEQKLADFLTLTKPRNSGFETVDLEHLIKALIRKCEPMFLQKQLTLLTQLDPEIPQVTVIPEDLSNAMLNLLVNAKNHTQQGGHVWIRTQCIQDQFKIIVEDDGPGIDHGLLTKIFTPFFTTRENGHGLGLAIVKRTVNAHNGNIQAENRSPTGARFIMTLPVNHD